MVPVPSGVRVACDRGDGHTPRHQHAGTAGPRARFPYRKSACLRRSPRRSRLDPVARRSGEIAQREASGAGPVAVAVDRGRCVVDRCGAAACTCPRVSTRVLARLSRWPVNRPVRVSGIPPITRASGISAATRPDLREVRRYCPDALPTGAHHISQPVRRHSFHALFPALGARTRQSPHRVNAGHLA